VMRIRAHAARMQFRRAHVQPAARSTGQAA
jgi:hypothetical protein